MDEMNKRLEALEMGFQDLQPSVTQVIRRMDEQKREADAFRRTMDQVRVYQETILDGLSPWIPSTPDPGDFAPEFQLPESDDHVAQPCISPIISEAIFHRSIPKGPLMTPPAQGSSDLAFSPRTKEMWNLISCPPTP